MDYKAIEYKMQSFLTPEGCIAMPLTFFISVSLSLGVVQVAATGRVPAVENVYNLGARKQG